MSDWWTYGLSDFLLFSPRTYYRMLERHNEAVWPAQLLALGLGLGILWLLRDQGRSQGRVIAGLLALLWGWVGWSFLWTRYATINWAASWFAGLFALEALLLVWIGGVRGRLAFRLPGDVVGAIGGALVVLSLLLYPGLAPLLGRPWQQSEVFGILPDPTAIGTLGLLLLAEGRRRWALLAVPMLWCAIAGATLWALASAA